MILLNTPGTSVVRAKTFSLAQTLFNAAGSYIIPGIGNAIFMGLAYRVLGFNVTWNLADPAILLTTDNLTGNSIQLTYNGGTNYTDPLFILYPSNPISGTTVGTSIRLTWTGAAFTPGGATVDFILYYVTY